MRLLTWDLLRQPARRIDKGQTCKRNQVKTLSQSGEIPFCANPYLAIPGPKPCSGTGPRPMEFPENRTLSVVPRMVFWSQTTLDGPESNWVFLRLGRRPEHHFWYLNQVFFNATISRVLAWCFGVFLFGVFCFRLVCLDASNKQPCLGATRAGAT